MRDASNLRGSFFFFFFFFFFWILIHKNGRWNIKGKKRKKKEEKRNCKCEREWRNALFSYRAENLPENSATDRQFPSAFCSLFVRPTFPLEKWATPRFHGRILEFYCHETQLCLSLSLSLSLLYGESGIHLRRSRTVADFQFGFSDKFNSRVWLDGGKYTFSENAAVLTRFIRIDIS